MERSPWATERVTSAIFLTWLVKLPAMRLTLSAKSFQVPATPGTMAWPPSLPSVPTSRATRVTSEVKVRRRSTMVLMVRPVWRNSPSRGRPPTSKDASWERSPLATAPMTRDISLVGLTSSSIRVLTDSIIRDQEPVNSTKRARWLIFPSFATAWCKRSSSMAISSFISTTSLKVSAILPAVPIHSTGRRTEKSPFFKAIMVFRSWLTSNASGSVNSVFRLV